MLDPAALLAAMTACHCPACLQALYREVAEQEGVELIAKLMAQMRKEKP